MPEERPRKRADLLMPMTEEHALRQFEIEALRQITDNLKRLNDKMDKQGDAINGLDVRMARIESQGMDGDVAEVRAMLLRVKDRLASLEADKNRREGAISLLEWAFKNWPAVFGFIVLIVGMILYAKGKMGP